MVEANPRLRLLLHVVLGFEDDGVHSSCIVMVATCDHEHNSTDHVEVGLFLREFGLGRPEDIIVEDLPSEHNYRSDVQEPESVLKPELW